MDLTINNEVYERAIWQDEEGHNQVRVVVNTFREVEYLHIRKYYLDFDGEWQPTGQGLAIPLSIDMTVELFSAVAEIMSLAESRSVIEQYFGEIIRDCYK